MTTKELNNEATSVESNFIPDIEKLAVLQKFIEKSIPEDCYFIFSLHLKNKLARECNQWTTFTRTIYASLFNFLSVIDADLKNWPLPEHVDRLKAEITLPNSMVNYDANYLRQIQEYIEKFLPEDTLVKFEAYCVRKSTKRYVCGVGPNCTLWGVLDFFFCLSNIDTGNWSWPDCRVYDKFGNFKYVLRDSALSNSVTVE